MPQRNSNTTTGAAAMNRQQIESKIRILETRLNAYTFECPLRYKVATVKELRELQAMLEGVAK